MTRVKIEREADPAALKGEINALAAIVLEILYDMPQEKSDAILQRLTPDGAQSADAADAAYRMCIQVTQDLLRDRQSQERCGDR